MGSAYSNYVVPKVQDALMHGETFAEERKILGRAKGKVLEIGFGTGISLAYYDGKSVTEIDPVEGMHPYAEQKAQGSEIPVKLVVADATKLPFEDNTFDTVTSTWTMCTIHDVPAALKEVNRVLKPGGEFLFVEHGVSRDEKTKSWQDWVNPPYSIIAAGCNLNRDITQFVNSSPLQVVDLTEFENVKSVWIAKSWYRGVATKGQTQNKEDEKL